MRLSSESDGCEGGTFILEATLLRIPQRVIPVLSGRLYIGSGARAAKAAKEQGNEEQEDSHGDGSIRDIKNGEIEVNLRNAKSDEINDVARVSRSIDEITQRATNNQAKDELDRQGTAVYHTRVHVSDDAYRDNDQSYQHNAIGKEAEGCSIIVDIKEEQVLPDQVYDRPCIRR